MVCSGSQYFLERLHGHELRQPCLLGLFHRVDRYFLKAVHLQRFSFGVRTKYEADLINAKLNGFFDKPFDAVSILGRRNGDMNAKCLWWLNPGGENAVPASAGIGMGYSRLVERALSVGYINEVPCL